MRYGYFDDANREYVIERPDTPRPWTNYIGSRKYGGVISNHAGGYSFMTSPAEGRLLRFRYNSIPADQPGRLVYLRDAEDEDYWSVSWQPVGKSLSEFESECRFGTGYAIISSRYKGIAASVTYFVPLDETFECWSATVTNESDRPRTLDVFGFAEFTNEWNLINDLLNLQYTQYIVQASAHDGLIAASSCARLPEDPHDFANRNQARYWWMTLAGTDVHGHDCDRETFLGRYGRFDNPEAVVNGRCSGSEAYADNACGALQTQLTLAPGEARRFTFLLGAGHSDTQGAAARERFADTAEVDRALDAVKTHWHRQLDTFQVRTPDAAFNSNVNVWSAYNALMTFEWSRSCSFVYTGDQRDGYGFRDTVQDCLGVVSANPPEVRARLALMLTGQESTGGARPEIRPWEHKPGKMELTAPERYRSDDCLWFFNAIPAYVEETGDIAFYDEVLPYSDTGEATVLGHMRRALEFNLERRGRNGLPCGLAADWNDCIRLGYNGESVFVTFQLRLGLDTYARIARSLAHDAEAQWAEASRADLDVCIRNVCWDGEWFIWAIGDDGTVYGTKDYEEGQVYLNTQVWAVISGAADEDQAARALETVHQRLFSPFGLLICDPALEKTPFEVMRAVLMNPGCKENGGIFSHTQSWGVWAQCLRGKGDRAFEYYKAFMPASWNDRAEVREIEPYAHCQSTHSRHSKREGASRVPWLSGTAAWANYTAQQAILGIQPLVDGLRIDPCIPASWPEFHVERTLRGKRLSIAVRNPRGVQKGVTALTINGTPVEGNLIPNALLSDNARIEAIMG